MSKLYYNIKFDSTFKIFYFRLVLFNSLSSNRSRDGQKDIPHPRHSKTIPKFFRFSDGMSHHQNATMKHSDTSEKTENPEDED